VIEEKITINDGGIRDQKRKEKGRGITRKKRQGRKR